VTLLRALPRPPAAFAAMVKSRSKDQEDELKDLQTRFNFLAEQQRAAEQGTSQLMMASRRSGKSQRSLAASHGELGEEARMAQKDEQLATEVELKKLDEQIVSLRRKHDQLHEKNVKKRTELDTLADQLQDLHKTRFTPSETPQAKLAAMEAKLGECAARYDDEHRLRMSYQQVIARLKKEQLEWPADVKSLEGLLQQKEADYEQLLVMSHDANESKESAKVELSKFETLVLDERKQREKELQERRGVLQKKQQLASELDRVERERRAALQEEARLSGEDAAKAEASRMEVLIREEQAKISAYEQAFQQIKEATGVSDVNEVIQRFLLQEETHQNLLAMVKEAQATEKDLTAKVEEEKRLVMKAEYSRSNPGSVEGGAEGGGGGASSASDSVALASQQKALAKVRERWKRVMKTAVSTKSAVQHIVDLLEPLREKHEVIAPMSDETLVQHLQFAEAKLRQIEAAFAEMSDEHKELLGSVAAPVLAKPSGLKKELSLGNFERHKDGEGEEEEDFEEDLEEDVIDRSTLKRQSTTIATKGAQKKRGTRKVRTKAKDE